MIKFLVFKNGKPVEQMDLTGSHLFAQDEIPVRSQLDFVNGELLGLRHSDTAVGLVTLWEVDGFGKLMLQTTRLPERNEPYNLNVELARGKLLRISQKREEWSLMELDLSEELHELIDKAQEKFIEALCQQDNPKKAAVLADESLSWSLKAGEQMASAIANTLLCRRKKNNQSIGKHAFGCSLDQSRINDPGYLAYIKKHFSFVTLPISWRQIETKEHERNFELLDQWVEWLSKNRIAIKVGPLINFSPISVPDWLYIWENDFDQVRDMAYDYITTVIQRYSSKVHAWDVISGINVENCFKFSFEQIIEMTRSCVLAARHAAPRSLVLVEISEPWGDYYAFNQRCIPPLIYVDMICQGGVNFNALGVKFRFGRGAAGMQARDTLELSALVDRLSFFGKTVHLTGVQVPSAPDKRDQNGRIGEAGHWHQPWSEDIQAEWLEKAYLMGLARPHIETMTWQDLVDRDDSVLQQGGLLRADMTEKPAFKKFLRLKEALALPRKDKTQSPID